MAAADGLHVVIVGAGITGLLLAQGLKKSNISFSVFEAEPSASYYRAREWGMSIQWALNLLPALLPEELMARLQSTSVDPSYVFPESGNSMRMYNAETGDTLKGITLVKMIRVSRRKFRALCAENIEVQYNCEVSAVNYSADGSEVSVKFTNGADATCNILVAADGANSIVRSSAFPDGGGRAQSIPYGGVNMHVCYHSASTALAIKEYLNPILAMGIHPKGYWLWISLQEVPDPAKPEDWLFQLQWTRRLGLDNPAPSDLDLQALKGEAASIFAEPFRTAWLFIPPGTKIGENKISVWSPQHLPDQCLRGHLALMGDAAHAMSFHRGQGLNHGIADAAKLSGLLSQVKDGKLTQMHALLEYEAEMVARAGEEVRVSRMNTEMVHDWQQLKASPLMQRGADKND